MLTHRAKLAALGAVALVLAGGAGFALAQTISIPVDVRVVAQRHADGRVEFGVEQGGERYRPDARYLPANAEPGRWHRSSPVTIAVDVPEPEPTVVEVPVEPPVVRLSVRPSDHPGGLVCLEQANDGGHIWTWARGDDTEDAEAGAAGHTVEFALLASGIDRGWSIALRTLADSEWLYLDQRAAWLAQCASYHGADVRLDGEYATDPDEWRGGASP